MRYFWVSFKAILAKDIVTELRAKQTLPTMIVLGMLIVWILRIVSEIMPSQTNAMGVAALWIAFLFSGLLAQERSFATEQQQDCIYGLLLAPVDAGTIYEALEKEFAERTLRKAISSLEDKKLISTKKVVKGRGFTRLIKKVKN